MAVRSGSVPASTASSAGRRFERTLRFLCAAIGTLLLIGAASIQSARADEVDDLLDDLIKYRETKRARAESTIAIVEPELNKGRDERLAIKSRRLRKLERQSAVKGLVKSEKKAAAR